MNCPIQRAEIYNDSQEIKANRAYDTRPVADWGMALDALGDVEDLVTEINEALDKDISLRDFVRQVAIRELAKDSSIQNDERDIENALEEFV